VGVIGSFRGEKDQSALAGKKTTLPPDAKSQLEEKERGSIPTKGKKKKRGREAYFREGERGKRDFVLTARGLEKVVGVPQVRATPQGKKDPHTKGDTLY